MRARVLTLVVVVLGLSACGPVRGRESNGRIEQLTQQVVQDRGTRTYRVSRAAVVEATAAALRAAGYEIALVNVERGILKTSPRIIGRTAEATLEREPWSSSVTSVATSQDEAMQFTARFLDVPGGGTSVSLEPRRFYRNEDITGRGFYVGYLDQLWRGLFDDLESALPVSPSAAAAPASTTAPAEPAEPSTDTLPTPQNPY